MASPPTHAVATAAAAAFFYRPNVPWHLWMWGAALAVTPDLDFIGFRLGIPYEAMLGHRGASHSLLGALVGGGLVTLFAYRHGGGSLSAIRVWCFLFLAMASHGVLDALTNGGLGVGFFIPFTAERYFFPMRPIEVSPLSISRFLSPQGLRIIGNELMWVWLPTAVASAMVLWWRGQLSTSREVSRPTS